MHFFKNFSQIFLITLIILFLTNIFISISWPIYSKFKEKKHLYSKEQVELLKMSEENLNTLYDELWRNYDKFKFEPFIGHTETERTGKFVNFTEEEGRKVIRPLNCNLNIYLYGGSTMFGYNVPDSQTIAQELQNLLTDEYCVFNQGRSYYYSKQENNLFALNIENQHKIDIAIFLDGVNERCGGYNYSRYLNRSFSLLVERPYKMWKTTSLDFLLTLPAIQFYNSLFGNKRWNIMYENLKINTCDKEIQLGKLFQARVNLRHGLCNENQIQCYSFLQPIAGVHGMQTDKFLHYKLKAGLIKKYNDLKKANKYVIDIGKVLDEDTSLSYIDGVHYSPKANLKIAKSFYNYVLKEN